MRQAINSHTTNTPLGEAIILYFTQNQFGQSSDVSRYLDSRGLAPSIVTVKRALTALVKEHALAVQGGGRSTSYRLTVRGRLFADVDAAAYCAVDPDSRYGFKSYNFDLFTECPARIMTDEEYLAVDEATAAYRERGSGLSDVLRRKETERFVIELSWKSSKIEGNTYSILDTERLIREGVTAPGHPDSEAIMILNHKRALQEILSDASSFRVFTRQNLERVHGLLTADLGVASGFRSRAVGITGSIYRPLENRFQIGEAIEALAVAVNRLPHGAERAFLTLLGISYVQPFEDGNKRTARLMANAILLANGLAPLSYRSVTEEEYRNATLVFYELNSLMPLKRVFLEQYRFATANYAVSGDSSDNRAPVL